MINIVQTFNRGKSNSSNSSRRVSALQGQNTSDKIEKYRQREREIYLYIQHPESRRERMGREGGNIHEADKEKKRDREGSFVFCLAVLSH